MPELTLIAGVARTGAIGDGETIPWYYEQDETQYKERVAGHPVVVGRRTHEGMSRIRGTHPVVVTRNPDEYDEDGATHVSTVEGAIDAVAAHDDRGYVIGGQAVYSMFLPYADRALVSELPEYGNGSRVFPYLGTDWTVVDRHAYDAFDVVEYVHDDPRSPPSGE
ncbi:dihydrofolate reductase [Haloarcula nitratireducens]|uniref:Dihydrofolate reductase n=1 Tax=Haloarcula nitratireducens TaxID=2487749 RepID=A0AAW4P7H9_9EURY|nr:dihydrofolate reductase [Halomicroarcula nitratireducens]MBX0293779.1 dihydrofolate reductase [Halomicroarcula nitratireducens]